MSGRFILHWQKSWGWANCLLDGYPECWHRPKAEQASRAFLTHFQSDSANFVRNLWSRMKHRYIVLSLNKNPRVSSGSMPVLPHEWNSKECQLSASDGFCFLGLQGSAYVWLLAKGWNHYLGVCVNLFKETIKSKRGGMLRANVMLLQDKWQSKKRKMCLWTVVSCTLLSGFDTIRLLPIHTCWSAVLRSYVLLKAILGLSGCRLLTKRDR